MFEPDEWLFTKLAFYFKRKKLEKEASLVNTVYLADIKARLVIFARAVTGEPIDIYDAQREGGYKNNNFFLPVCMAIFPSQEENISYYLFRVLYLSVQKNLGLNWAEDRTYELAESQEQAFNTSNSVLESLLEQFPICESLHEKIKAFYEQIDPKNDFSFIYGKWMKNENYDETGILLKNVDDKTRQANKDDIKTTLKSKAVEEIISVQVDQKQQEDMVLQHQFEKVETAEEFSGNWKDFDGDDEIDDHSNALDDVNMKFTVRVDDSTHSVYQADFIENTTISESAESDLKGHYIKYDEWNHAKRVYKQGFCKVYPKTQVKKDPDYYKNTLSKNRKTLEDLRKMLSSVDNKYQKQRRQSQGGEFDLDAVTDMFVDINSGHSPSENVYLSKRKKEKDLSILILLDVSLSSDGYAAGNRVLDVEKEVSILFGEILNEYNIDFSINCFFSKTRNHSTYTTLKDFDENWNEAKHKIGTVEPNGYTRIGPALRHSGALLDTRETKNKWMILISDGKPNDYDKYEGKYGVNDVKQALRELNERNINTYALAIEASAKFYLPQMFGQKHYEILTTPVELLQSLAKLYDKIKHQS